MVRTLIKDRYTLTKVSEDAVGGDGELINDLLDTLDAYSLFISGLAANMIGVNKRIIAFIDTTDILPKYKVMLNPEVVRASRPYIASENCICLSAKPKRCKRYKSITVVYLNANMEKEEMTFKDDVAQVIQHLIDHCNGVMI